MPPGLSLKTIREAIERHRRGLRPSSPQEFAITIGKFAEWAATFGIAIKDPKGLAEQYREHLGSLPVDLLLQAFRRIETSWEWRNLPLPGNVLDQIGEELNRRRAELGRLELAEQRVADPKPQAVSDAERPRVVAMLAANRRWLERKHTAEDLVLLNGIRAKHGYAPLRGDEPPGPMARELGGW